MVILVKISSQVFCKLVQATIMQHFSVYHTFKTHSEENILVLRRELASTLSNFQVFSELSINDKFINFDSLIQKAYFKHCSKKTKTIASPEVSKPWITASLRINRKHQLHKDSLNYPLLQDEY